jgi:hypothetical protein
MAIGQTHTLYKKKEKKIVAIKHNTLTMLKTRRKMPTPRHQQTGTCTNLADILHLHFLATYHLHCHQQYAWQHIHYQGLESV